MSIDLIFKTIDYLNKVAGKEHHPYNTHTIELLNNLIKLNYGFEDFKLVIDKKVLQWKSNNFNQYLRPATLFGNKFENYLNEQPPKSNFEKLADSVNEAQQFDWGLDRK